jgi:GNAT superfamily N-acetyltransferase
MDDLTIKPVPGSGSEAEIVIAELPAWFGEGSQNFPDMGNLGDKDAFAAYLDGEGIGLIALKYHFGETAEIWWFGVRPEFQKRGAGSTLFVKARDHAIRKGCKRMAVSILSDRSIDTHYDHMRAFYISHGFRPLLEYNENDPVNPMMWMILTLQG